MSLVISGIPVLTGDEDLAFREKAAEVSSLLFAPADCRLWTERISEERFEREINEFVEEKSEKFKKNDINIDKNIDL